jgi:hypothetical protein
MTISLARTANDRPLGRVLPDQSKPSYEQLMLIIADLQSKVASPTPRGLTMKVSEKGCLSIYGGGLNFRGVHLYASQWETILANADKIAAFIKANPSLARKTD